MLRIAICDDELLHCAYTAQMIERTPEYADARIRQYTNPQELLDDLKAQSFPADIAIVDVCMEQMNGIALAKQINALVPSCQIIFLSAYLKYATEVYAADHVYFVLKEQMESHFIPALQKAVSKVRSAFSRTILLKNGRSEAIRISEDDIISLERVLRKTRIQTTTQEYWTQRTPAELLTGTNCNQFFRCHQSYYVNMQYVVSMVQDSFLLKNGQNVPISRSYKNAAKERFLFTRRT